MPSISPEEQARRQHVIDQARHSTEMEGGRTDDEARDSGSVRARRNHRHRTDRKDARARAARPDVKKPGTQPDGATNPSRRSVSWAPGG